MKREATYLENLFIKDTFDQSIQRTIKTTNNLIKKWRKTLILFTELIIQMANKHMKRCFTLYIIREMQIKTMKYHYTLTRMVNIQNTDNTKCC